MLSNKVQVDFFVTTSYLMILLNFLILVEQKTKKQNQIALDTMLTI